MIEMIELGKCCEIINGSTPSRFENKYWNGDIDWFTPKDLSKIEGKYLHNAPERITAEGFKSCSTTMLPPNSLLFTSRAPIGHIAINTKSACTNQGFKSLIPKNNVDVNYLYFAIKNFTPQLQDLGNGATFKELSKSSVSSFKIPLPPLPQQKKIANILDASDDLIQNNKAVIAKYDELTQALFLDMFGDPVSNPKGWKLKEGSRYYEVRGRVGWKGYKKTDLRQSGAIVLGATHVNNLGTIDLSKVVYLSQEKYIESPEIMVKKHDLIFVQRGNTIGKLALIRDELGEATINPVVLIFRPIKSNPYFLLYLLMNKGLNREFVNSNSGSAQPMITQKTMKEFLMIDIPLSLQNKFAERVALIEEQRAIAQKSLEKSEELFDSLLQKAFKGELV